MAERSNSPGEESRPSVSFETALERLEEIVADLEGGTLGLEDSMRRFEEAVGLLRTCYETLQQAEGRIEMLVSFDEQGRPLFAPFDATATIEKHNPPPDADEKNADK